MSSLTATLKLLNSFLVVGASVYFNFALCIITIGIATSKLLCPGYVVRPLSKPTFKIILLSAPWDIVFLASSPHHSNGYVPPFTWLGLNLFVFNLALIFSGWLLWTDIIFPSCSVPIASFCFLSIIPATWFNDIGCLSAKSNLSLFLLSLSNILFATADSVNPFSASPVILSASCVPKYLGNRSSLLLILEPFLACSSINIPSSEGDSCVYVKFSIHHCGSKLSVFANISYALLILVLPELLPCIPVWLSNSFNPWSVTYLNSKSSSTPSMDLSDSAIPLKSVSNVRALLLTGNPRPM